MVMALPSPLLLVTLALAGLTLGLAAPVSTRGNATLELTHYGEAVFASEPRGRGTVSLIVSCTSTFVFCIWTAVHPNIVPGCTGSQRLYYRAMMMVFSIIVPEGILICAIGEYRAARSLRNVWKAQNWPGGDAAKQKMSMEVAFFVVMGGFVIDEATPPAGVEWMKQRDTELGSLWKLSEKVKSGLAPRTIATPDPNQQPRPFRAILTPTGFIKYMEKGLIHEDSFDKAAIIDKGKASNIGKILAGSQALWLVVASISRWKSGLPLTFLEIHVLIHVVRTALIYAFWWEKPLDVHEPIRIRLGRNRKTGNTTSNAFLSAPSPAIAQGHSPPKTNQAATAVSDEDDASSLFIDYEESLIGVDQVSSNDTEPSPLHPKLDPFAEEPLQGDQKVLVDGKEKSVLHYYVDKSLQYTKREPKFITLQSPRSYVAFQNKAIYDIIIQLNMVERKYYRKGRSETSVGHRLLLLAEALLVCLTGTLHAAVWNNDFPTITEQTLWRTSALTMCACSLGMFLIFNSREYDEDLIAVLWKFQTTSPKLSRILGYIFKEVDNVCTKHANKDGAAGETNKGKKRRIGKYILHQCVIWFAFLITAFYFFSVLYITLESFLSLREVPRETFMTPAWTDYWPHV
ncbi:hypothetical protein DFP73DRAFT_512424 [Morchella snyderi]|nr:hypothetical protein DFP73DRAFT_512424 [Morchella snyderi]